ncbi:hypothetical protein [Actinomadura verrucosospora]
MTMPLCMCSDMRGEPGADGAAVGVNMKLISETLGHARHSFTADTYTSVLPEVSRAVAEAVAAVVPRRTRQSTPDVANVISPADRRNRRGQHAG